VVDDAVEVRDRIVSLLSDLGGVEVSIAASVAPAREILPRQPFDIALLDLKLPDGTGLDVLRAIRGAQSGVVVVIVTAFETPYARHASLEAGADLFLGKGGLASELPGLVRMFTRELP
jgi:DNA-binding response OmpR family regulator